MLSDDEIRALFVVIIGFDHRPNPGQADITAWATASDIAGWTFGEARNAIVEHFSYETEYLKPGHVTQRIKANRRQPARPLPAERQLDVAPPAKDATRLAAIRAIAARLGWIDRRTNHSDPELKHACPHPPCGAGRGRPCGRRVTRGAHQGEMQSLSGYHASRTELVTKENHHA
jgi:hypothetical protein